MTQSVMRVAEIRKTFLDFFASKGHTVVESSPLVPGNDPTLMFTNSGMVQFKDVFLGTDRRSYVRAASVQACLRAGGKHNDLENVGYTARHHTFFEMLGNWSFGDYFKRESLKWAWELLTEVYKLPKERLLATVYAEDDEAFAIWTQEIGLPPERVIRIGDNKGGRYKSDNFWMMADTGPCGPCSEIFYDHGEHIPGGPPGSPGEDGDRFIEIWNNVFMQFNMDETGAVTPLPAPCVDTGMGLERLAAILQHVHSNYEIDLFDALIRAAARETGSSDLANPSLKVIADHIRATAFLVSDGVIPGNEGRGYVQRRIVRRAIRHGYKLGKKTPFFHKLVADLARLMGDAYPKLREQEQRITEVLRVEEERFFETLATGMEILDTQCDLAQANKWVQKNGLNWEISHISQLRDGSTECIYAEKSSNLGDRIVHQVIVCDVQNSFDVNDLSRNFEVDIDLIDRNLQGLVLPGNVAFKLHDTYGFPLDLTNDVCRERGMSVDEAGFTAAMEAQKAKGRAAGKFRMDKALEYSGAGNAFVGYDQLTQASQVLALYVDGAPVHTLEAGQSGVVVLDTTPFYAESGGQVGDQGSLFNDRALFEVSDTQKIKSDVYGHHGSLGKGRLQVGDALTAHVDAATRAASMRNHSVTHLMHKALRQVLGQHVQQKGSLVDADKTRFDFTHNAPVTDAQIREIEALVNAEILANAPTQARLMPIDQAKQTGAMMLFGEKYGDIVRVLDIGTTTELCGGTHVRATGDIGYFSIVSESGVAAGVRRVEAVTGTGAMQYVQGMETTLAGMTGKLRATADELPGRLDALLGQIKELEKELAAVKGKLASAQGDELLSGAVDIKGVKVLAARLEVADAKSLRDTMDKLKSKLKTAVIVLAAVQGDKVQIAAGVSADTTTRVKAGDLVNHVASQVGGKGGGKADMAMAGGTEPAKLGAALESVRGWVTEKL